MTSGEFHRVPVDKIWVIRGERQRKELRDIPELADDIRRNGLIHPLVIDRNYKLCTGERRLAAIKMLCHDFVMCQWFDELDAVRQREIELAENIKRIDLSWQEQCAAVTEYHKIRSSQEANWTHEKTASALGVDRSLVTKYSTISEEDKKNPRLKLMDQPLFSTANNIVQRDKERRSQAVFQGVSGQEKKIESIINADFCEWAKTYTGDKFNFLHCDFPYGIDTDKRQQGTAVAIHGGYEDTEATYWRLVEAPCDNLNRICTESAHIMFWFSMHYYHDTLEYFKHTDIEFDPFPLIWHKSDGKGLLPDPQRGPRRVYETALFGSRGDRKIVKSKANACSEPTVRGGHLSTKPEPVLRHFFEMFVDENTSILDPTCGSGTALRVAKGLHAAHVLGIEINPEFAEVARRTIHRV
jgi:DNA methylase/ParB-like nuclease domain